MNVDTNKGLQRLTREKVKEMYLEEGSFIFDGQGNALTSSNGAKVWVGDDNVTYVEEVGPDGKPHLVEEVFDVAFVSFDDDDDDYYYDDEPAIAEYEGVPLTKANVIEYLKRIVDVEANKRSLEGVCRELNADYRQSTAIPPEVAQSAVQINKRNIIIAVVLALIVDHIGINNSLAFLSLPISLALVIGAVYMYIIKPKKDAAAAYEKAVADREARIRYNQEHAIMLKNNCQITAQLHDSCVKTLNDLYGMSILHPKYRNMAACAYIEECLETGRTGNLVLTGADPGAFNLYEEELRAGRIIDKLDNIESKIDRIIENQKSLYLKLDEINANVQNAVSELKQIKYISAMTAMNTFAIKADTSQIRANTDAIRENTAATAFFSQCAAQNTASTFSQEFQAKTGLSFNY